MMVVKMNRDSGKFRAEFRVRGVSGGSEGVRFRVPGEVQLSHN